MSELKNNVEMVANLLRGMLEELNLYIGVDKETNDFLFFDRDDYHNNSGLLVRVHMEKINVRNK